MTDIAVRAEQFGAIAPAPRRLVEWADEARAAHALAVSLCETPFAGQFKGNAAAGTAAILRGSELGLTPVTSLGAFDLIAGTPAPKAVTLRALVQSHGHSVWIESSTDTECVAKARRFGEDVLHESRWTIERAQKMGLTGKDNWKKQPAAMLIARATSEVCRLVAADLLLGIGYSSEEVRDDPALRTPVAAPASAPSSVAALRASAEPVEPTAGDASPASDAPGSAELFGEVVDPEDQP